MEEKMYTTKQVVRLIKKSLKECNSLATHIFNQHDSLLEGNKAFKEELNEWLQENIK